MSALSGAAAGASELRCKRARNESQYSGQGVASKIHFGKGQPAGKLKRPYAVQPEFNLPLSLLILSMGILRAMYGAERQSIAEVGLMSCFIT